VSAPTEFTQTSQQSADTAFSPSYMFCLVNFVLCKPSTLPVDFKECRDLVPS